MAANGIQLHPHIFNPNTASAPKFQTPRPGRGKQISLQQRDREAHAEELLRKLKEVEETAAERLADQKAEGVDSGHGIYLQFESEPGFDLKFDSLDFAPSGIELCSVRHRPNNLIQATVFVPDGKLNYFLKRVSEYKDEETKPNKDGETRPKHEDLVAGISNIRVAALEALWTDSPELLPSLDQKTMWEVWLRRSGKVDHLERFREHSEDFDLTVGEETITFLDRTIVLVHGKGRDLSRSIEILGAIAELRLAKTTAAFFSGMTGIEQQDWIDNIVARTLLPAADAPYVCLFDTGLNQGHPLLASIAHDADLHSYKPNDWGVNDRYGHGTQMAGLAAYGDLSGALGNGQNLQLTHRLESLKIINSADPHEKDLYGAVTKTGVDRVEVVADRRRVYCMAISTTDDRDRGRPSSWSAAIDELTSGRNDNVRRLMLLSAGNTEPAARAAYPDSNMTDGVHDPAQAWNALTVGGYTEKVLIDQTENPGWEPLAQAGDLAPSSCTSMTWKTTKWPIKPDIVLEAGNMARHPDHVDPDYIEDSLLLLTTPHDYALNKPLVTFSDTSAATGIAAQLAGRLWSKYPNLTPEAVRALMVHSASWTPAMLQQFTDARSRVDYDSLVRCYGYGVPNTTQLLSSADNVLTLVSQGHIQPLQKEGNEISANEMKLHNLPWPTETLAELQNTPVTLRVTLSYFVEPNPGDRGWSTKYGYQSHGLRFEVKRALETVDRFQQRINKAARSESYDKDHPDETGTWMLRTDQGLSTLGSLHSNTWTGLAADLATRGHIAVYPTYGWWAKRRKLECHDKISHYALVATITTPEQDIYTPVATSIDLPLVIET